ncbi:hypothetical protein KDH_14800 [Dictyobacter sp. S3.2.2.5]|uniref:Glycoside hydrolase n=1 Tax=Dictyobacter halimunensis TaxID=3026934 RepID=A0ABQ6FP96_9CHLR|nr:hypothetical protein KDH_14800 [Dictyobacter sp. S3.2.2.5]
MTDFQQLFRDPPIDYRLVPFWFWNDAMEEEEIIQQIKEMAEKGVGGFFICARQGLEVAYLSEQWFQRVAVAVEAARRYGLHTWLYDEYPYPSGMSGGEVTLEHPDARHRQLLHQSLIIEGPQELSHALPWTKVLFARALPLNSQEGTLDWSRAHDLMPHVGSVPAASIFQSTGLTAYTRKRFFTASPHKQLTWSVPPGRWQLVFFLEDEIHNFKYFGTYVDPCHKEAVQTFLQTTHERYASHFQEHFGQAIKGVFTDEVGLLGHIPWSAQLSNAVQEQDGSSLIESLPAVFYPPDEQSKQARYRFFQRLHQLLRESYHQQISSWCEQHHLQYMTEVPSMRMTTQLFSHIPGGDSAHEKIGRSLEWILDENAANLRADPKIASSLANQLGTERTMIECFHSLGWSMTLQDAKWMLDRLAAMGINFYVFHAFFSSIDGLRKHDAPPSQFQQNPYWPHFRQLADYAGRLGYVMSQGSPGISVAVVHPATSFWTHMGNPFHQFRYCGNDPAEEQALQRLKGDWTFLCKQLLLHQIDYDHLDPELLAQATIEDGHLVIGHAHYETLILPPLTNLEVAAWSQVKAFLQAGGKVISVGLLPYEQIEPGEDIEREVLQWFGLTTSPRQSYWQDASASQEEGPATTGSERFPQTKGAHTAYFLPSAGKFQHTQVIDRLLDLLRQCTSPEMDLEPVIGDRGSFLVRQRSLPDGTQIVFITHQEGMEKVLRLHLLRRPAGQVVERLDLTSGHITPLPVEQTDRGWTITLPFASYEAHLIRYQTREETQPAKAAPTTQQAWAWSLAIQQPWKIRAQQDNILRLGKFHFLADYNHTGSTHHGAEGETWPVVEVKPLINQCADVASSHTMPIQFTQSFGLPVQSSLAYPLHCWYHTTFVVEQAPLGCKLLMDKSAIGGDYTCYLNDHPITAQDFTDLSLHGFPQQGCEVGPWLQPGLNRLAVRVEGQRDEDGLRDPLYLSGDFGVSFDPAGTPVIGPIPETGEPKSGIQVGYPYFAGTLCFTREAVLDALPRERTFALAFDGWDQHLHDCVEVLVNGHSLGVCCWSPYHWEGESDILRQGQNEIEVRVTNTLSGMLEGSYFEPATHQIVTI